MATITRLKMEVANSSLPVITDGKLENYYVGKYINALSEVGYALSTDEYNAVRTLIQDAIDHGWLRYVDYLYPFIGDNETPKAGFVPLINNKTAYSPDYYGGILGEENINLSIPNSFQYDANNKIVAYGFERDSVGTNASGIGMKLPTSSNFNVFACIQRPPFVSSTGVDQKRTGFVHGIDASDFEADAWDDRYWYIGINEDTEVAHYKHVRRGQRSSLSDDYSYFDWIGLEADNWNDAYVYMGYASSKFSRMAGNEDELLNHTNVGDTTYVFPDTDILLGVNSEKNMRAPFFGIKIFAVFNTLLGKPESSALYQDIKTFLTSIGRAYSE